MNDQAELGEHSPRSALAVAPDSAYAASMAFENRIPPLLLVLIVGAVMAGCDWIFPALSFRFPGQALVALLVAIAAVTVMAAAVVEFRRARTTVDPLHPSSATALVRSGIFSLSRNPMYLGMALLLAAWALFLGNAVAVVPVGIFVAWINRFQIVPEERALRAHFGEAFNTYASEVRRWI